MKLGTIIVLVITFSANCQSTFGQRETFYISGRIELLNNDLISKNRMGLVIGIKSGDSIRTTYGFDIGDDGHFLIDKLTSGTYELTFKVNPEYQIFSRVVTIENDNLIDLKFTPPRKPCDYDALKDINDKSLRILTANGTAPRINSKEDDSFEKRYKISYVILGDVRRESWNCLKNYNNTIFEYLDKEFGTRWRKKVRKDAIGMQQQNNSD